MFSKEYITKEDCKMQIDKAKKVVKAVGNPCKVVKQIEN